MKTKTIKLEDTNYFSSLMLDYVNKKEELKSFYSRFPNQDSYIEQADCKLDNYNNRSTLVKVLNEQMRELNLSKKQKNNLELLAEDNTVTITTGHQLNLFTGPIFFFYKILQVIKQCKELNKSQSKINFVPIFWMATEDHDFEEINHFRFGDRVIHWDKKHGGPVGQLSTEGLKDVFTSFLSILPQCKKKEELRKLIESSYLLNTSLANATRILVNTLFRDYGLLMLDGDDKSLKNIMKPVFEKELIENLSFKEVTEQADKLLDLGYKIQVNPREINLFYMNNSSSRERIVFENDRFYVLNTDKSFTSTEIVEELNNHPEKFSPNVILRPLYQETILPNVSYIGGGGEIAYWLELKSMFDRFNVDFPLLVLRNSMLIRTEKQFQKQLKLNLRDEDLFIPSRTTIKNEVINNSELINKLPSLEERLHTIFEELEILSKETDSSFADMVSAQKSKQLKGFQNLEKRLVNAEIKKNADLHNRIEKLLKELSQNKGLQERSRNFSDFDYVDLKEFISSIYQNIQPFSFNFIINTIDEDI